VKWKHNLGAGARFTIELSRDGGSTWTTLASGVGASSATAGTYRWTVSAPATSRARVRVSCGALSDVSNADFRIY
jgi:hypothetical protein